MDMTVYYWPKEKEEWVPDSQKEVTGVKYKDVRTYHIEGPFLTVMVGDDKLELIPTDKIYHISLNTTKEDLERLEQYGLGDTVPPPQP